MWILPLVGYIGIICGFTFLTLAIASGLYYLSELVEEHTVISKRILTRLIQAIIVTHVCLFAFDRFPFWLTLFSGASHGAYAMNLRRFPMVALTDGWFIGSCILVVSNHILWFRHFSKPPEPLYDYSSPSSAWNRHKNTYSSSSSLENKNIPSFSEISAFFGLCVWLVPFALFVSLSAGENVLPSSVGGDSSAGVVGGGREDGKGRKGRKGLFKGGIDGIWEWLVESAQVMSGGGGGGGRRRSAFD
ncbi:erv26 superfamily protein [Orbilia blumenaviensis]|uniref:Erv26 superfamily protein n=1 Tax=Orbilia blumenaviensis TaxID=1796055 RepID=A0AAV9VNK5_9PEZI